MTDTASAGASGAVTGGTRTVLRLEGLALFIGMTSLYYIWDGDWLVYALLFFVPDLSFAAYLSGPRFGAMNSRPAAARVPRIAGYCGAGGGVGGARGRARGPGATGPHAAAAGKATAAARATKPAAAATVERLRA